MTRNLDTGKNTSNEALLQPSDKNQLSLLRYQIDNGLNQGRTFPLKVDELLELETLPVRKGENIPDVPWYVLEELYNGRSYINTLEVRLQQHRGYLYSLQRTLNKLIDTHQNVFSIAEVRELSDELASFLNIRQLRSFRSDALSDVYDALLVIYREHVQDAESQDSVSEHDEIPDVEHAIVALKALQNEAYYDFEYPGRPENLPVEGIQAWYEDERARLWGLVGKPLPKMWD